MDREGLFVTLIGVIIVIYFLPGFCACIRGKRNKVAIMLLNILAGWTFVGWVIALVWAWTKDDDRSQR